MQFYFKNNGIFFLKKSSYMKKKVWTFVRKVWNFAAKVWTFIHRRKSPHHLIWSQVAVAVILWKPLANLK